MNLRHTFLVGLLALSSASFPLPGASAAPTVGPEPAQGVQKRGRRSPAKAPVKKKFPGGGGGGGTGGGGTSGGGDAGGSVTSSGGNSVVRRRRGGRRGRNRNRGRVTKKFGQKSRRNGPKGGPAKKAPLLVPEAVTSGFGWRPRLEQEEGVLGTIPPQPVDVRLEDLPVHQDTYGRAPRELLALTGDGLGGFAATWLDRRDDEPRIYFGRYDGGGRPLEPERCASIERVSATIGAADVTLGRTGGAVAWSPAEDGSVSLRAFDATGALGSQQRVELGTNEAPSALRLVRRSDGGSVLVARWDGRVKLAPLRADGSVGPWVELAGDADPATGDPIAAAGSGGRLAVIWPTERGLACWPSADAEVGAARVLALRGRPLALAFERSVRGAQRAPGAWLLHERGGALQLVRLSAALVPDARPIRVPAASFEHVELVVWSGGPAVLVESAHSGPSRSAPGERSSRLRLHVHDPDGRPAVAPIQVDRDALGRVDAGRLAVAGPKLMVAWNETRNGATDLMARVYERRDGVSISDVRLTTDRASATQHQPAVGSHPDGGAVTVWTDRRDGVDRVFARRLSTGASLDAGELALPAAVGAEAVARAEARQPAVAVDHRGAFLVAWKERLGSRYVARAQAFGSGDRPLGPAFPLDAPGFDSSSEVAPGVVSLSNGGWAVLWDAAEDGARLGFVGADGDLLADRRPLTDGAVRSLALQRLDDDGLVTIWTEELGETCSAQGRLLSADSRWSGLTLELGPVQDCSGEIAVAAADDGGFALAWGRGPKCQQDVVVGFFDRVGFLVREPVPVTTVQGTQHRPSITRLTDGSWVVAWQDDLSGEDQIHARRLRLAPFSLGPTVTVNQRAPALNGARRSPRVAALGDGFVATWTEARRSRGLDVFARVLGAGFDRVE